MNIFSKDAVLLPVNHYNEHWAAASINFRKKRLEYYDSLFDKTTGKRVLRVSSQIVLPIQWHLTLCKRNSGIIFAKKVKTKEFLLISMSGWIIFLKSVHILFLTTKCWNHGHLIAHTPAIKFEWLWGFHLLVLGFFGKGLHWVYFCAVRYPTYPSETCVGS